ncbi:hypothetical protein LX36DRAFT_653091 [Colletotrichum falcatum]|nr:hypothetical protein LX36DRAFT_653091 [Colletotrichum falcatum]
MQIKFLLLTTLISSALGARTHRMAHCECLHGTGADNAATEQACVGRGSFGDGVCVIRYKYMQKFQCPSNRHTRCGLVR